MSEQDADDVGGAEAADDAEGDGPEEPPAEVPDDAGETPDEAGDDPDAASEGPDDVVDESAEPLLDDDLVESGADVDPAEDLVERVEAADPETVARELATLRDRVADLEAEVDERGEEIDDLESRLARKQADFQNYKQRQEDRLTEEKRRATEDLVKRLLDVRDNLQRALDQEGDADIRSGIESTLGQFDGELERENVESIEPEAGDQVDPQRHEVLMRVDSDQPAEAIADVHRPGYEMAGKVLRPAQVTVSDGNAEADGDGDDGESGETAE